jgi:FMN-dependent NADH-azoreductase
MTETSQYRLLSLDQVTEAITRSLEDKRFTYQEELLVILLAEARLLALNTRAGIYTEAEEKSQDRKIKIASALQYFAGRAGEPDIFASYGIMPVPKE